MGKKNNWLLKWSAKGAAFTHLLLDGGKLFVNDQQHSIFLNEYSNAIARGETLYVAESRTPIFRLFVDFDFKPVPSDDVIQGAIRSAGGIAGYYFEVESRAVVLRKDVELPDKVGVHMTWDAIFVNTQIANAFRNHLVSRLLDACPDVDWKEVVDASVYAGSGLRMPWSNKRTAPGVYRPVSICTSDGSLSDVDHTEYTAPQIREWVRATSIRAPDATLTPTCVVTTEAGADHTPDTSHRSTPENLIAHADILQKVHACLPEAYADQRFTAMHRYGNFCIVLRSSSKKCGNKDFAEHHTNTVYFVVLKKGWVYQRCYCRKDVLRASGVTCTDYMSEPWPVPKDVVDAMWPPLPKQTATLLKMLERTRPPLKKAKK